MKKYIFITALIGAAFFIGLIVGNKSKTTEYKKDVMPEERVVLKAVDPYDIDDLRLRAYAPIIIGREYNEPDLSIVASDGYKQTTVHDKIIAKQYSHLLYGGVGVLRTDLKLFYTAGYFYKINRFYVGGQIGISLTNVESLSALAGISF